ncbi:MAG: hypothetical protein K0Q58_502 [Microbacterium sp.]|nr:hypothetical protein [Microbacterium sp.]
MPVLGRGGSSPPSRTERRPPKGGLLRFLGTGDRFRMRRAYTSHTGITRTSTTFPQVPSPPGRSLHGQHAVPPPIPCRHRQPRPRRGPHPRRRVRRIRRRHPERTGGPRLRRAVRRPRRQHGDEHRPDHRERRSRAGSGHLHHRLRRRAERGGQRHAAPDGCRRRAGAAGRDHRVQHRRGPDAHLARPDRAGRAQPRPRRLPRGHARAPGSASTPASTEGTRSRCPRTASSGSRAARAPCGCSRPRPPSRSARRP